MMAASSIDPDLDFASYYHDGGMHPDSEAALKEARRVNDDGAG